MMVNLDVGQCYESCPHNEVVNLMDGPLHLVAHQVAELNV